MLAVQNLSRVLGSVNPGVKPLATPAIPTGPVVTASATKFSLAPVGSLAAKLTAGVGALFASSPAFAASVTIPTVTIDCTDFVTIPMMIAGSLLSVKSLSGDLHEGSLMGVEIVARGAGAFAGSAFVLAGLGWFATAHGVI